MGWELMLTAVCAFHPLIPVQKSPLDLDDVSFAFVAVLFSQFDWQRFEQAECDVYGLKIFGLDV